MQRRGDDQGAGEDELVRHEEELVLGTRSQQQVVRLRTEVHEAEVEQSVPRRVEELEEVGRTPAVERDSGQIETLPDGSISIPILEEELVVTKRVVVRERVILRKRVAVEDRVVRAQLRGERLVVDGDPPDDAA
jgi:uncharacterized protein (TIGR02271 family)